MVQGIPALLATLGALAATGLLISRANNDRLPYLIAWCLTLVGISVSLASMAVGFLLGFRGLLFRVMELGGALIAPVWLALGMVVLISRFVQVRFAAWLFGVSYSVVAVVILMADPLKGSFTKNLPKPSRNYDSLPLLLIDGAHVIAVIALVVCTAVTAVRASRQDRAAYDLLMPVALAALAGVLLVSGTRGFLPGLLAVVALAGAAGLVWFGAMRTLPAAQQEPAYSGEDYQDQNYGDPSQRERGYIDQRTGYDEQMYAAPAPPPMQQPPMQPPMQQPPMQQQPPQGPLGPPMDRPGVPQGPPPPIPPVVPSMPPEMAPGAPGGMQFPGAEPPGAPPLPPLCGQITVYTLLDGREEAFDRVAQEVVRAARSAEPDTLIFTCHEVANAPTQRIVYQLFRDQAAFAEHQRLPHVQRFVAESRPHVLATNVIELKLNAAKVVPLPSLTAQDYP